MELDVLRKRAKSEMDFKLKEIKEAENKLIRLQCAIKEIYETDISKYDENRKPEEIFPKRLAMTYANKELNIKDKYIARFMKKSRPSIVNTTKAFIREMEVTYLLKHSYKQLDKLYKA